jgi:hypothetical protein
VIAYFGLFLLKITKIAKNFGLLFPRKNICNLKKHGWAEFLAAQHSGKGPAADKGLPRTLGTFRPGINFTNLSFGR